MRYAAFLRGVMPTNCKMPALKGAFENAGFTGVKTYLGSGNVTFDAPKGSNAALEKKIEAALEKSLGRSFMTFVRTLDELRDLIASDPYKGVKKPHTKKIVTFLREPPKDLKLPLEQDNASVFRLEGHDLFTVYAPTSKGPVFMKLIETAAGGKNQTSRTWDTVRKVAELKT